jgi:hypothetical protein
MRPLAAGDSAKPPCLLRRIGRQGRTMDGGAHRGMRRQFPGATVTFRLVTQEADTDIR